jgi:hypothetical protein
MPIRYVIDKKRRLVISFGWDRLTFAEIRSHQDQLTSDPNFNPNFNQLIDTTGIAALEISTEEAQILASRQLFSPSARRAFVATNPTIFGMGRLMETYHEIAKVQEQVCVFYDIFAALNWLGLEDDPRPANLRKSQGQVA